MAVKTSVHKIKKQTGTPLFVAGIVVIGMISIAVAVFIGKSDHGQIDVTAALQNSNQANAAAGGDSSGNVEVIPDTFKNMTNGGLVPQENQPTPKAEEVTVSETASSSGESASTTTSEPAPQTTE